MFNFYYFFVISYQLDEMNFCIYNKLNREVVMIVLSLENISMSFGIENVISSASFALQDGEKMGLVGSNGSGKSTLLRIITGEISPSSGMVHISRDANIGYIAQTDDIDPNSTLLEAMLALFQEAIDLEKRIVELEKAMHDNHDESVAIDLADKYHKAMDRYNAIEGYAYNGTIQTVLNGLGFDENQYERKVSTFSGGEKARLSLAKMLLKKPNILLLDEPSNHLDLDALDWLERYLQEYKGALIVISHDRYFLDNVCTSIGELIGGKIIKYDGNYSAYQKKRAITREAEQKAYEMQEKYIEREKNIIKMYKAQGAGSEKKIKQAMSREKRLEKIDLLEKPAEEKQIRFSFNARMRSGEEVLKVHDISKGFNGKTLFKHISFEVRAGDRIALIGKNGIGKSTLFNIIMKKVAPDEGYSAFGVNVDPGYFEQEHRDLIKSKSVLDNVWDSFPKMEQYQVRAALGMFLFRGDDVFKTVGQLSGGEQARVMLTKLMLSENNFLLLDEPTNHLDADSREVLEEALQGYNGTILAISHDRYFINKFANKVIVLKEENITSYLGNYDDYLQKKAWQSASMVQENSINKTEVAKQRRRSRLEKQRIKELENQLALLESAILKSEERCREIELSLADPDTYKDLKLAEDLRLEYNDEQEKQLKLFEKMEATDEELNNAI